MTPSGQTVCLCMIVKDEAPVIRRCLNSVRPLIDSWAIVDAGSTDGTPEIVREVLAGLSGEVTALPGVDAVAGFAEALALARQRGAFALLMDADDDLDVPDGFALPDLTADSYTVDVLLGPLRLRRPQILRTALDWRREASIGRELTCDGAVAAGHLPVTLRIDGGGMRRSGPDAARQNAAVLLAAAAAVAEPAVLARITFALARCCREAGEAEEAVRHYLRRAEMGFSEQEVYVSLLSAGRIEETLGRDADEILAHYRRADATCPLRAEAAHAASRLLRGLGRYREGHDAAARARGLPTPAEGLQVEPWIYRFGLLDELAVNAYWAGLPVECRDACLDLLAIDGLPEGYPARVTANLRHALDALARAAAADDVVWCAPSAGEAPPYPAPALLPGGAGAGSVSIITPTRDRARFLRRAARYVRAQTHGDVEWLILDDSAQRPDLPGDLGGANIRYEHSPERLSIGEKRNRLIERARGETIVHFDDDDYYAPSYVTTMLREMEARDADILNLRGWFLYDLRSRFFGYWDLMVKSGPHYRCGRDGVALRVLPDSCGDFEGVHFGFGFSYAFRKWVWDAVKFPHIDWYEDGGFIDEARQRFVMDGFHDTSGLSLHVVHATNTSLCFPQYRLPTELFGMMFPNLLEWARNA